MTKFRKFLIFCDGGIGNRINALLSGLAIAHHFNLEYCIHWPVNNWCAASFEDIFETTENTSTVSLKNLKGKLDDAFMLLHDHIASDALGVNFNSAYAYEDFKDFEEKVIQAGKVIFYYPALMPEWIPLELIHEQLRKLKFTNHIQIEVENFIKNALQRPFYGLHLRRTDLNVGLNDHEVLSLVSQHPEATFFVCSDDPNAEALASAHPNVHRRIKSHAVEKKSIDAHWLAQSLDDDGRLYYGNIKRGREAVIEGTIDLLILAHSQIIGFSGSTFQRMAKMIGDINPTVKIEKPAELTYYSIADIKRKFISKSISADELISICNKIGMDGNMPQAIEILQNSIEYFDGNILNDVLHTLSIFCLNQNLPQLASIYLNHVYTHDTTRYSSLLHLSYAKLKIGKITESRYLYEKSHVLKPKMINSTDENLDKFINTNLEDLNDGI